MRISDSSSDVCSSDLSDRRRAHSPWQDVFRRQRRNAAPPPDQPGRIGTRTRDGRNSRARSRLLVQLRSAMKIEKMTLRFTSAALALAALSACGPVNRSFDTVKMPIVASNQLSHDEIGRAHV